MLFKNNTMTMVTDLSLVANDIRNLDFVIVAGITDQCIENVFSAAVLMPPTELLMAWADGAPYIIQNKYPEYLYNCKEADDMIVSLLAALTKKNVIVYIPKDEFAIFGREFLNHMYYTYGIVMNTPNTNFSFNTSKIPLLLSKFYMMDLMTGEDFLKSYPPFYQLLPFVINKLAAELKPFGNEMRTFDQYAYYFNNLVKQNGNMIQPIKIVKEVGGLE